MSKFKKMLAWVLVVALTAGASIAGTMAYFTDEESAVNVMTVGNVDVKLEEKQRNENGSALEDFEQAKDLTPLVGSAQGEKDQWGQPVAKNYVDKIVYATNKGINDAYIRFLIALPKELVKPDAISDNILHWSFGNRVDITGNGKYNDVAYANSDWAKMFTYVTMEDSISLAGEEYIVTYFTMQKALEPGENSLAVMAGMYLDKRVDYDDESGKYTFDGEAFDYDLSKGVNIPVLLQAVQSEGWDSIDQAFEDAYGELNVTNVEKWFGDIKIVFGGDEESPAMGTSTTNVVGLDTDGGTYNNYTILDQTTDKKDGGMYFRALYGSGIEKDLTVNNSYLQGLYAMNVTAKEDASVKLSANNTTFDGWVSYSGWESATFVDCTFIGEKTHSDYAEPWVMSQCRVQTYDDTTFTNCEFGENFAISNNDSCTITLNNCYKEGVKITAENFNALLNNEELNGAYCMDSSSDVTIIVDGETVKLADIKVASAEDLQTAVENGGTITLTEDIALTSYLNITAAEEVTINLNGNDITRANGTAIYVNNKDAVVNITGDGNISGLDGVFVNAGTVNIYGGTYTNSGNVTIYVYTEEGAVNIYDGTFSSPDDTYVLNVKDGSNGKITVYGGKYYRFSPAYNYNEGKGTNFCAEGYTAVRNAETQYYEVIKSE